MYEATQDRYDDDGLDEFGWPSHPSEGRYEQDLRDRYGDQHAHDLALSTVGIVRPVPGNRRATTASNRTALSQLNKRIEAKQEAQRRQTDNPYTRAAHWLAMYNTAQAAGDLVGAFRALGRLSNYEAQEANAVTGHNPPFVANTLLRRVVSARQLHDPRLEAPKVPELRTLPSAADLAVNGVPPLLRPDQLAELYKLMPLSAKAAFALRFIDLERATGIPGATWSWWQIEFLNSSSLIASVNKSRQIGSSFLMAVDAVCDAILSGDNNPRVFVSINRLEAGNKIKYIRSILNALVGAFAPENVKTSGVAVELEAPAGMPFGPAFISLPCRPVRGYPQARVYLDEIAHYGRGLDQLIYDSALPATLRGGYVRAGSSPLGAQGLHHAMQTDNDKYGTVHRLDVPWYTVAGLCLAPADAVIDWYKWGEADPISHALEYGNEVLVQIAQAMDREAFLQEFCASFLLSGGSFFPLDLLQSNQRPGLYHIMAEGADDALAICDEIAEARLAGRIYHTYFGIDIGRTKDLTEIVFVSSSTDGNRPVQIIVSLPRTDFDTQYLVISRLIEAARPISGLVDQNGIGLALAERLQRSHPAVPFAITMQSKAAIVHNAKFAFERRLVPMPLDREIITQFNAIKKHVTPAGNTTFKHEGTEKGHQDRATAVMLALYASMGGGLTEVRSTLR